jgi:phenylpropionate dioxygenase-like ring-hydroxylating dioxygenase large terminal subunit
MDAHPSQGRQRENRPRLTSATTDIGKESILIVKTDARHLKAYYNVCLHRGRRLKEAPCGNTGRSILCKFHGWSYKLDGDIQRISCRHDWDGISGFTNQDLRLREVKPDTFAGWVRVSMDPSIVPLREYLAPIDTFLAPYELEDGRMAWSQSIVVKCNWKVVVDAFNEAYHAPATHPTTTVVPVLDGALWHRMPPNGDDPTLCVWDIWSLERFPPGKEPEVKNEFFADAADFKGRNPFLEEDFANMQLVQKGMRSRGFRGGRTNPVQERTVSNFHRVLYDYLFAP